MLSIDHIFQALESPKKIFITTHQKPDADAIGSSLGLYHYLKQKGHQPTVVVPNELPDFLHWMPGVDTVLNFESEPKELSPFKIQEGYFHVTAEPVST